MGLGKIIRDHQIQCVSSSMILDQLLAVIVSESFELIAKYEKSYIEEIEEWTVQEKNEDTKETVNNLLNHLEHKLKRN